MTEQQRQARIARGELWTDTDEYLAHQARVKDLMYEFNASRPSETDRRRALMKRMFLSVGENVWINQPITLAVGSTVTIGEGTYINSGLILIDDYSITIGKGCLFGTNVTLCTTGHPIDPEARATGSMYSFPITIGDGAWIGAGAIVLPGVNIGKYAVIGAGSVVTRDVPDYTVAVGNPCRPLRKINEHDKVYYWKGRRFDAQAEAPAQAAQARPVRIEHVAMYVNDLEGARDFFVKYLGGRSNDGYRNPNTGFRSYFIAFDGGARLELMQKGDMVDAEKALNRTGYSHVAFSAGSREAVDALTERLRRDGYAVVSGPRTTGDGYYESCVVAIEGNQIEITV